MLYNCYEMCMWGWQLIARPHISLRGLATTSGDVCSQRALSSWHETQCRSLALAGVSSMSADKYHKYAMYSNVQQFESKLRMFNGKIFDIDENILDCFGMSTTVLLIYASLRASYAR